MSLSLPTVKSEANSIYRKLGVSSRSQAVARSRELGLLEGGRSGSARRPGRYSKRVIASGD